MSIGVKPLFARVIVERKVIEETKGGIILAPEASQFGSMQLDEGIVLAVGEHAEGVAEGDYVYWGKYAGGTFNLDGKLYWVMNDEDILAVKKEAK